MRAAAAAAGSRWGMHEIQPAFMLCCGPFDAEQTSFIRLQPRRSIFVVGGRRRQRLRREQAARIHPSRRRPPLAAAVHPSIHFQSAGRHKTAARRPERSPPPMRAPSFPSLRVRPRARLCLHFAATPQELLSWPCSWRRRPTAAAPGRAARMHRRGSGCICLPAAVADVCRPRVGMRHRVAEFAAGRRELGPKPRVRVPKSEIRNSQSAVRVPKRAAAEAAAAEEEAIKLARSACRPS